MVRLLLVRHAETAWNAERRHQGVTDVPLSRAGKLQAMALARRLVDEEIHVVYASDLQRAWETATIISAFRQLAVLPEPRLREIDFGIWEGLTYDEIFQHYPQELANWEADPMSAAPSDGETMTQVAVRIEEMLDEITRAHQDQSVLLVAHSVPLQVLLCSTLDRTPQIPSRYSLKPASLSEIYLQKGGVASLTLLNDIHHLRR